MSNNVLVTIARNRPNMIQISLCITEPQTHDYLTLEPLDAGFGDIVQHCKELRRLSLSGLLTDRVFEYIGVLAKKLEILSLAFVGDSNLGLHYVLSGCESLRKLEIRDCPFGDEALLANAAKMLSGLNVEVIDERGGHPDTRPERFDTPGFVWIIGEDAALTPYSNGSGFFLGRLQVLVLC
ncbi:hypothetical protein H5410_029535 [Solanum commersonii]|uniref:Uncharacterized protein n=1 Tax=Solanum commersonii TaxID=4109 RepID=A0A9J5YDI7_SOLCO|nr:hypothetical protein H5410_029535 [Solanum commersonii]